LFSSLELRLSLPHSDIIKQLKTIVNRLKLTTGYQNHDMKITTWNVNGIRAAVKKGALTWAQSQDIDVLCLQEVKAQREQLPESEHLAGYSCYWNAAQRPGYSGVAVYSKTEPLAVDYGLGDERFDDEGRVIRLRYPGLLVYNIYFPNGQRGQGRVDYKLDFYACLLEQCDRLHAAGEQIVITGDFNTAHREIDLSNPKSNAKTSGFLPEERAWIDRYLEHGFVDVYRSLYPQRIQYTWWTFITNARARNIGWRLDYFLVSPPVVERAQDVVIHDEVPGSDHCPVSLVLKD
jgi:exodeoxyribonuclease III